MDDFQERILDRLDRVVDRLDRLADRDDRISDRQDLHTSILRRILDMTSANQDASQELLDALGQLDNELSTGLGDVASTVNSLNEQIASLTSLNDQEKAVLQQAAAAVTGQVTRVTQAFSSFKAKPETPVEPTPVPDPEPAPSDPSVDPGTGDSPVVDPANDPSVDPGPAPEVGPVGGGTDNGGDSLAFGR